VSSSVALDELALAAGGFAECGGGDTVDVAKAAEGSLVDHRDSIGGEDLAVAADGLEAEGDVVGSVVGQRERLRQEVLAGGQGGYLPGPVFM